MVASNENNHHEIKISLSTLNQFLLPVERDILTLVLKYTPFKHRCAAMTALFEIYRLDNRGLDPKEVSDILLLEIYNLMHDDDYLTDECI